MTVTKRMSLLVLSALLGIILLAGLAYYQLHQVFERANFGNNDTVPAILGIDAVDAHSADVITNIYRHLAADGDAATQKAEKELSESQRLTDEALKAYEGQISDDTDKRLWEDDRQAIAALNQLAAKVIPLSRASQDDEVKRLLGENQEIITHVVMFSTPIASITRSWEPSSPTWRRARSIRPRCCRSASPWPPCY